MQRIIPPKEEKDCQTHPAIGPTSQKTPPLHSGSHLKIEKNGKAKMSNLAKICQPLSKLSQWSTDNIMMMMKANNYKANHRNNNNY